MFSKIIIALLVLFSLFMFCRAFTVEYEYNTGFFDSDDWSNAEDLSIAILLVIVCLTWLSLDYYEYRIYCPARLIYYKNVVKETKSLMVDDKKLNMTDMQLGQTLADRIQDLAHCQTYIKIAKINPWVIFKPTVKDDELKEGRAEG